MTNPGPLFYVTPPDGRKAPFYALQFDKEGRQRAPLTTAHLLDALRTGDATDVVVFCHGWNNDWDTALARYRRFLDEFHDVRARTGVSFGRDFRPVLVGIFWPSTALVWPWEKGPGLAAAGGQDGSDPAVREAVESVADVVAAAERGRLYALVEAPTLDRRGQAWELAAILARAYPGGDPELEPEDGTVSADDLVATWAALDAELGERPDIPVDPFDFGTPPEAPEGPAPAPARPEAAGAFLDALNPRTLVRAFTVRQMKDRAGAVGARGVGPVLREAQQAAPSARFHLVGHSYGARVLLNAVARPDGGPLPRPVDSLLLLQPAVNHLCFTASLPTRPGTPGGYRAALDQVRLPLLSTYSSHDFPLTRVFHLALCREKDLGEIDVAAAGEPPNRFAALGGFGPRGELDWRRVATKLPGGAPQDGDFYDLGPSAPEVWALDAQASITGHGDVANPSTAWALLTLARAS